MKPYYLLIAATALMSTACNDIAPSDRFIPVEAVRVERAVLLEDFTGQNCVNCPAAHRVIEALEEQYGESFIPVSIHAGPFGISVDNKRYTGLATTDGDIYCARYGIVDFPQGVLDGQLPVLDFDEWASAVYEKIQLTTPVSISISPRYEATGNSVEISCHVSSSEKLSGNFTVWIIESGIVARQEDINEGRIHDYVHNNVFRACVNGIDGEPASVGPDNDFDTQYSIAVKEGDTELWNVANLSAVAFFTTSAGVEQATSARVEYNND